LDTANFLLDRKRCLIKVSRSMPDVPDFPLLLAEGAEWHCERACAKRDDQFAAIIHGPPQAGGHYAPRNVGWRFFTGGEPCLRRVTG